MPKRLPLHRWICLAAVTIGLPSLYVLSHGPWWYVLAHHPPPPRIDEIGHAFYSPIWSLYYAGTVPEDVFGIFMDYNSWWANLGGAPQSTIEPQL